LTSPALSHYKNVAGISFTSRDSSARFITLADTMVQPYSPEDRLPAAESVREWDRDTLHNFLSTVLTHDEDKVAFAAAWIDGEAFLLFDEASFAKIKGLHLGPLKILASLVSRIKDDTETLNGNKISI
jgi:hypothetical protein